MLQLTGAVTETTPFMKVLKAFVPGLTGLMRSLNGADRGSNGLVNDSAGFARFLTRLVSKMAWLSNEMEGAPVFLARGRNDLTPAAPRSSGFRDDLAGFMQKLKGIKWFLDGRRLRSTRVVKSPTPVCLLATGVVKRSTGVAKSPTPVSLLAIDVVKRSKGVAKSPTSQRDQRAS
ncbi:MAG TPA: hypothetical protein VMB50_07285 [Myxococcales bacterium]|nr:hypothetical protein [Myxococcales bacterium]